MAVEEAGFEDEVAEYEPSDWKRNRPESPLGSLIYDADGESVSQDRIAGTCLSFL